MTPLSVSIILILSDSATNLLVSSNRYPSPTDFTIVEYRLKFFLLKDSLVGNDSSLFLTVKKNKPTNESRHIQNRSFMTPRTSRKYPEENLLEHFSQDRRNTIAHNMSFYCHFWGAWYPIISFMKKLKQLLSLLLLFFTNLKFFYSQLTIIWLRNVVYHHGIFVHRCNWRWRTFPFFVPLFIPIITLLLLFVRLKSFQVHVG